MLFDEGIPAVAILESDGTLIWARDIGSSVGISVPAPSYYQRDGVGHHFYGYRLTMGFAWQRI